MIYNIEKDNNCSITKVAEKNNKINWYLANTREPLFFCRTEKVEEYKEHSPRKKRKKKVQNGQVRKS